MMKTDFKLSSKMHLFIIISCIIIAVGIVVGTICQCVANGYFNYGADWSSYKSVTVSYSVVEYNDEKDVKDICEKAFKDSGVVYYSESYGDLTGVIVGGQYVFKFNKSVNDTNLNKAVEAINSEFAGGHAEGEHVFSRAVANTVDGLLGSGKALWRGAVAIASVIAFHFIYFAIRYKLAMALGAVLADVHNLVIFASLLSATRIPVGSSVITFAVLTVLATVIGTCFLFDRVRKNTKDESCAKLTAFELVDKSASESFKINLFLPVALAATAAIMFILFSISAMSAISVMSSVFCALVCFVSCGYGLLLFTPSVFSRFKQIGDEYNKKHTRSPKEKKSK